MVEPCVVVVVGIKLIGSASAGVRTHGFSKTRRSSIAASPRYELPNERER